MELRRFLFLQGPPGPFFALLAERLRREGCKTLRVNLNGGDAADWPGTATAWRGRAEDWSAFVRAFMADRGVTDLLVFGDCRPLHLAAHGEAARLGIRIHVLEEGYVRPHWMTLERDGVNGRSRLPQDPAAIRALARDLPSLPQGLPPVTASFGRRLRDTLRHYTHAVLRAPAYPFHRSHRPGLLALEALAWARKLLLARRNRRRAERVLRRTEPGSYFLFPLQLGSDYQIRAHSPFASMEAAAEEVIASFARTAPSDARLLVKEHPLDTRWRSWRTALARMAGRHGVAGRVTHLSGGDLATLAAGSRGVVVVNSTSATFALDAGVPVAVLGSAVYAIPGLVHRGPLDAFWRAPVPPDMELWAALLRVLHARCLVRGGIASKSAVEMLVDNVTARLLAASPKVPA